MVDGLYKGDMSVLEHDLNKMKQDINQLKQRLDHLEHKIWQDDFMNQIDCIFKNFEKNVTIRMGSMIAVFTAILSNLIVLTHSLKVI